MTRIERIKSMNSEEMAKKVEQLSTEGRNILDDICMGLQDSCPYMDEDGNLTDDCDCVGCIVKWLESEDEGCQKNCHAE